MSSVKKVATGLTLVALGYGTIVITKDFFGGAPYKGRENLGLKTAIITGPTSGIGRSVAYDFAHRGARVILASKDMIKCARLRQEIILSTSNKDIVCRECDLASLDSVRKFADLINTLEKDVNILVNNAGVMPMKHSLTEDGFEKNLGTNYLGHFLLTMLILDKLKKSSPSRILNLTSIAYPKGKINFDDLNNNNKYDDQEAHLQSKLALVYFTKELAKRLEGTGVTCNAVYPGISNTMLRRETSYYKSYISSLFVKPLTWLFTKSAKHGSYEVIYGAVDPALEKVSGKLISKMEYADFDECVNNKETSDRLWAISDKWTKLS